MYAVRKKKDGLLGARITVIHPRGFGYILYIHVMHNKYIHNMHVQYMHT